MEFPKRNVLLNPGPATTTDSVKAALVISDICPRERSFCDLYADVRRRLAALAGDPEQVVAIPVVGSGTTVLEAGLVSLIPPGGRVLILDNGDYGTRLAAIAAARGLGAEVRAFGVRPAAKEQVESLGRTGLRATTPVTLRLEGAEVGVRAAL